MEVTSKRKVKQTSNPFDKYVRPLLVMKEKGMIDTTAIPAGNVYLSRQVIYKDEPIYQFTRDGIEYKKSRVINKLLTSNYNLFERLRENQPRKLYFDIDIDSKRGHANFGKYSITDIVRACDTVVKVVCEQYKIPVDIDKHTVCYVADMSVKQSLHITYPLYFKDYYECKQMFLCIQDKLLTSVCSDLQETRKILVEGEKDQKLCYIDDKVYAKQQNMRCLYQSKANNTKAVLIPLEGSSQDPIDHLIGCYGDLSEYTFVSMKSIIEDIYAKGVKKLQTTKPSNGLKRKTELRAYTQDEIKYDMTLTDPIERIMSCIPNSNHKPQSSRLFHTLGIALNSMTKITKIDYKPLWVRWANRANDHYPNEEEACTVRWNYYNNHNIFNEKAEGLLRSIAYKYVDKDILRRADTTTKYNDIFDIQTIINEQKQWDSEIYNEKYCRDLDFTKYDIIIDKSGLGTGKTTVIKKYTETSRPLRMLIVGTRVSFCREKHADFKKFCPDIEYYKDTYDLNTGNLSNIDKLVIQYESLHKLGDIDAFSCYDLLVLDESEAILSNVTSETNGINLQNNIEVLEQLIRTSKKVVMSDAFVSKRTLSMVEYITKGEARRKKVLVRVNDYKRKDRKAHIMCLQQYAKCKTCPKKELIKAVVERVGKGERVVVCVASRMYGEELCNLLIKPLEEIGKDPTQAMRFYERFCDDKQFIDDLTNVREAWNKLNVLVMTTKITVGVNFDDSEYVDGVLINKEKLAFNATFIYASNSLPCIRDLIQAHFRVRHTREDNIYVYIRDVPDTFVGKADRPPPKRFNDFKDMSDYYTEKYGKVSSFYDKIQVYNEYETDICYNDYTRVFKYYLMECGYEVVDTYLKTPTTTTVAVEQVDDASVDTQSTFTLPNINIYDFKSYIGSKDLCDALDRNIKSEKATRYEKVLKEAIVMYKQCLRQSSEYHNDIKEMDGEDHEGLINELLQDYIQPHVKVIIDNIKFEKQMSSDTATPSTLDTSKVRTKQQRNERYTTVKELCNTLTLETSYSVKDIEEDKMIEYLQTFDSKSKLCQDNINKLFKIRPSKATSQSMKAKAIIQSILKNWCGNTVETEETSHKVRDTETGKMKRYRTYQYKTEIDNTDIFKYVRTFSMKSATLDGYSFITEE